MTQHHTLTDLPFSKDALEPWMSRETLDYHHGKHHKGYVDKLNGLVPGTKYENMSLEEIVKTSDGTIFNNAGQVWNHTFFWNCLTPETTKPSDDLLLAIDNSFGTLQEFEDEFKKKGGQFFGSGWVWLVQKQDGTLSIETTVNADNPLRKNEKAILTCDLWEHAYYIDYRNEKAKFLDGFLKLLNWDFVSQNFDRQSMAA